MSDEFSISEFLDSVRFFHEIRNKDKNGRYRSWEYCNNVFNEKHNELLDNRKGDFDLCDEDYDYLALHLSFYLASWGMYRGSSILLSTDYKIHIPIVKELMREKYDDLWNISYNNLNNEKDKIMNLINKIKEELYGDRLNVVKKIYNKKKGSITDTLATKILLGTLACIPAYDTYFTEAIKKYKSGADTLNPESIEVLAKFYEENRDALNNLISDFEKDGIKYPQMKILDMGFFEYGKILSER